MFCFKITSVALFWGLTLDGEMIRNVVLTKRMKEGPKCGVEENPAEDGLKQNREEGIHIRHANHLSCRAARIITALALLFLLRISLRRLLLVVLVLRFHLRLYLRALLPAILATVTVTV